MVACQRKSLPNLQKYLLTRAERKVAVYGFWDARRKPTQTRGEHTNYLQVLTWLGYEPRTQRCKDFQVSRENRNNVLELSSTFLPQSNRRKLLEFISSASWL
ncbi:glycerol-3-phosphate acyltransferase 1, mitochondrial-like isoform X2 [Hyperolius riggenbachi]|uniref:glycerol-3-phosphate acyltransferase 1, mitochondrial-like isoform X2 n=1 Tax=Hyperolius riggenbachi TaxID=752182 RepID=UPI0035A34D0E